MGPKPYKLLRGATRAPQPILPLIPRPGAQLLDVGEPFALGLRILGRLAPDDETRLRGALEGLASRALGRELGRLNFEGVVVVGERDQVAVLDRLRRPTTHASVEFETPAWIEVRKRLAFPLDLPVLVSALYRRLCTICALYGELDEADETRGAQLDELVAGVTVERQSLQSLHWQRKSQERGRHPMKGIWGSLELSGEMGELAGILRMAEVAHVGKATSHGLGRIRVELS